MNDLAGPLKPLTLLELIASSSSALSLADLTAATRLPKATLHRWLAMLEQGGLIQRSPDQRRFEPGARASRLALSILNNNSASSVRHEVLERVVKGAGEACNLTVLVGTDVVYLDRVESTWPLRITLQQGSRVPVHCSASGKVFLAFMPPAKRRTFVESLNMVRHTPNTITDKAAFARELGTVREQRYALDREEYLAGLVCLAVPVTRQVRRARQCVAALALQAPSVRLSCEQMVAMLPLLREAADAVSASFD